MTGYLAGYWAGIWAMRAPLGVVALIASVVIIREKHNDRRRS